MPLTDEQIMELLKNTLEQVHKRSAKELIEDAFQYERLLKEYGVYRPWMKTKPESTDAGLRT